MLGRMLGMAFFSFCAVFLRFLSMALCSLRLSVESSSNLALRKSFLRSAAGGDEGESASVKAHERGQSVSERERGTHTP